MLELSYVISLDILLHIFEVFSFESVKTKWVFSRGLAKLCSFPRKSRLPLYKEAISIKYLKLSSSKKGILNLVYVIKIPYVDVQDGLLCPSWPLQIFDLDLSIRASDQLNNLTRRPKKTKRRMFVCHSK